MTDEQINAAIAKACGITQPDQYGTLYRTENGWGYDCPNYCNDLNAMHEAEKVLTEKQVDKYIVILCLEVQKFPSLYNATASQRAEAFLRALGKWEATIEQSSAVQKEVQG